MKDSTKSLAVKLIKFLTAFGLIYWMIQSGILDLQVLKKVLTPLSLAVCLGITFTNLIACNYRWSLLLGVQNFDNRFKVTFPLFLIGIFFSFAIPGAVGGDVVKGYYLAKGNPKRKMVAITSLLLDRVIGLFAMVTLSILAIIFNFEFVFSKPDLKYVALAATGLWLAVATFLLLALIRNEKKHQFILKLFGKVPLGQAFLKVYEAFRGYGSSYLTLVKTFVLSLVAQTATIVFIIYIGFVMGASEVPIAAYFFAVPLGFVIMAVPIAPAGIGVGQIAFLTLFKLYTGIDTQVGQIGITVFQMVLLSWGLLGAYFYMQKKDITLGEASS